MPRMLIFVVGLILAVCIFTKLEAGEIDLLLDKLVEKGILTPAEAQQIKIETREEIKKSIAQAKHETLPLWLQTMKMKGDFRLRYQYNRVDNENNIYNYRHRGRIRFRLGLESQVNDKLQVGAGLATGLATAGNNGTLSADYARSTNQSFSDAFSKKPITLDYAYATYTPFPWLSMTGGKFKNPFWEPTDMLWDTDINPEGGVFQFNKRFFPGLQGFLNLGVLIIDENSGDSRDPMLYAVQPGLVYTLTEGISLKGAFTYYNFSNTKGRYIEGGSWHRSTNSLYGNTRLDPNSTTARLKYAYAALTPALELSIDEPLKALNIPLLNIQNFSLFGEYVNNPHLDKNASGWAVGFRLGAKKIQDWGDWQWMYNYVMLERDAFPDFLPDSDRYNGTTGIRAHETTIEFGLGKNTSLGFDYYCAYRILEPRTPEHLVQVDWKLKW